MPLPAAMAGSRLDRPPCRLMAELLAVPDSPAILGKRVGRQRPAEWSTRTDLELGRVISRFPIWTPTRALTGEATRQALVADNEHAKNQDRQSRSVLVGHGGVETHHQPEPLPAHLGGR